MSLQVIKDDLETLTDMRSAFDMALVILNDLLNYDKLESGSFMIEPMEVPALKYLSRGLANQLSLLVSREKSATLKFDVLVTDGDDTGDGKFTGPDDGTGDDSAGDGDSGMCYLDKRDVLFIDKYKMDQVFRNLCSNALKFTPRGKTIMVRVRKVGTLLAPVPAPSPRGADDAHGPAHETGKDGDGGASGAADVEAGRAPAGDLNARTFESSHEARGTLVVQVIDQGAGIAAENQQKLFKQIVQFNPGELQAGGGSGLGMMISKGIADMHGGTLSVWSAGEGHGTTFTLKLPLYSRSPSNTPDHSVVSSSPYQSRLQSAAQSALQSRCGSDVDGNELLLQQQQQQQQQQQEQEPQQPDDHVRVKFGHMTLPPTPPNALFATSGKTDSEREDMQTQMQMQGGGRVLDLLVVDDSKLNRRMLRRLLATECGHRCEEAEDGAEAVRLVRAKLPLHYDAILMDFVMPEMDGPTATREIRRLGHAGLILGVTGKRDEMRWDGMR